MSQSFDRVSTLCSETVGAKMALLSLGSSPVVANIFAGVIFTYTRAFQIGDRIKIADTIGDPDRTSSKLVPIIAINCFSMQSAGIAKLSRSSILTK